MIEVRPLVRWNPGDIHRLITGYISGEIYRVSKQESPTITTIRLEIQPLPQPYIKREVITADDLELYQRLVREGRCLGAFEGSDLVGLALNELRRWNRTLWIWEFHIAEMLRRQGMGRKLMEAVVALARREEARVVGLETQNTNAPAIRFYRATGFEMEGIDLSLYTNHDMTDFEVAIYMKRKLE